MLGAQSTSGPGNALLKGLKWVLNLNLGDVVKDIDRLHWDIQGGAGDLFAWSTLSLSMLCIYPVGLQWDVVVLRGDKSYELTHLQMVF